jgi:hypothetical protein
MKLFEHYGMPLLYPSLTESREFVCGLECEIEAVDQPAGSYGIFATIEAFKDLHAKLNFFDDDEPFGQRTSIHVHVNCLSLEDTQIKNIMLLYVLFEEFFFMMTKAERRWNIHCVPLTETTMPLYYSANLWSQIDRWHKYAAFNLKPLGKYGTIEFRHMHGMNDADHLDKWLKTLENLWTLSQNVSINSLSLSSEATLKLWFYKIFKDAPEVQALEPNMFNIMQNNLIDAKFAFI